MIRIGIGTEPRTEIARKVLEYSILKNSSSDIKFYPLMGEDFKNRGILGQGTGFSLLRFILPEYFNYEGKAIYLDADMLVLSDIKELWEIDKQTNLKENIVWCKLGNEEKKLAETSVMLINCKNAKNKMMTLADIEEYLKEDVDRKKYREIMKLQYLNPKPIEISRYWNIMDKGCCYSGPKDFSSKKAKLLHFTDIKNQPWYQPKNPNSSIWGKYFKEAYSANYFTLEDLRVEASKYDYSNPRRPNGLHPYWIKYLGRSE